MHPPILARWTSLASVAALVIAGAVAAPAVADPAPADSPSPHSTAAPTTPKVTPSGAVIVMLKDQLAAQPATKGHLASRRSLARDAQRKVMAAAGIHEGPDVIHYSLANGFAARVTQQQADRLAADSRVASVVADTAIPVSMPGPSAPAAAEKGAAHGHRNGKQTRRAKGATGPASDPFAVCPSDPSKPLLEPEALSTIKAANQTGAPSAADYATGAGVKIAVMAESIDPTAPDFLRPDGSSAIVDYKDFTGSPDSDPGNTYGAEIFGDASSIAAQGNVVHDLSDYVNPAHPLPDGCNIRIKGVAPGSDIVALKILSGGNDGTMAVASAVAQAIDYAVTNQQVDILSESIGALGTPESGAWDVVQQFNDAAIDSGVVVVASTGDAGTTGTIGNPAADPRVISAAGSTTLRVYQQIGYTATTLDNGKWLNGNIASFSSGGFTNSGHVPVLTAPGDGGWSVCTDKTDLPTDCSYGDIQVFGGTSQSAPFIAATAALVMQAYRDTHHGRSPSPELVRQILTSSADDLGSTGHEQGAGQVNALNAVRLARSLNVKGNAKKATKSLLVSTDQITNQAAQGASVTNDVTVTNTTGKRLVLNPAVRKLVPIARPEATSVQLNPATDPSFPSTGGTKITYQKLTFTVQPNIDQFTASIAYPSASDFDINGGQPQVTISLLDPDGAYAGSSRPQGGTSASNYGRVEISKPQAGEWTAIISSQPTTKDSFGFPTTVDAFKGIVHASITQNRWSHVGTVSPARAALPPGHSRTFTVKTRMPAGAGDSAASLTFGAPQGISSPVVTLVQRVLVNMITGEGSFTGGLTGGNGRGLQPAQTQTFAFDVPKGKPDLEASITTAAGTAPPRVIASLVDPNGQVQSMQNNGDAIGGETATSRLTLNTVASPIAGRWRLVVRTVSPSTGLDIVVPFEGKIRFGHSGVDAGELARFAPGISPTPTLPTDQNSTLSVKITNNSGNPQTYYLDSRTAKIEDVELTQFDTDMPASTESLALGERLVVPPGTTSVSAKLTAPIPVQAQLTGPTAPILLTGPNAVGPVARPENGVATSVATMATPSGHLTTGHYGALAGSVGPFGSDGAPKATAHVVGTATTWGFDRTVTPEGGDLYRPGVDPTDAPGVVIPAGKTATLTMRIHPLGEQGDTVQGVVNVVQAGRDDPYSALMAPALVSTAQVMASIPYHYKLSAQVASIQGRLTSVDGPLAGARAVVFDSAGTMVDEVVSDENGHYSIGGLQPGADYRVCFDGSKSPGAPAGYLRVCYRDTHWDGGAAPAGATAVTVPASGPATGVDQVVTKAAGLGGTVTNPSGAPVANIAVLVFDEAGNTVLPETGYVLTGPDGKFTVTGLEPGDYFVCTVGASAVDAPENGYLSQCNGQPWNLLPPTSPAYTPIEAPAGVVTDADVHLQVGGAVSGTVVDTDGKGVSAMIQIFDADGNQVGYAISSGEDGLGEYRVTGLPTGQYRVCASAFTGGAECYDDVVWNDPSGSQPAEGATPVDVVAGEAVQGIDFRIASVLPGASAVSEQTQSIRSRLSKSAIGRYYLDTLHVPGAPQGEGK